MSLRYLPLDPDALRARIATLPTLPTVAGELLAGFDEAHAGLDHLGRLIATDQALAACTLRVANSAFYGLCRQIDSVPEAVVVLGLRAVRALVVAAAAVRTLPALPPGCPFDLHAFWRHGVGVAVCARHLAELTGHNPDTAFTTGLLHDVGQLVLALTYPERFAATLERRAHQGVFQTRAELDVLGLTHAEAGAMLAARWGFPPSIAATIALHHRPEESVGHRLAGVIHVADVLAHGLGFACGEAEPVPPLCDATWHALGIAWPALAARLGRIENDFEATVHALLP